MLDGRHTFRRSPALAGLTSWGLTGTPNVAPVSIQQNNVMDLNKVTNME